MTVGLVHCDFACYLLDVLINGDFPANVDPPLHIPLDASKNGWMRDSPYSIAPHSFVGGCFELNRYV